MRRRPAGIRFVLLALAALVPWALAGGPDPALGADPLAYTTAIAPTGDAALDQSLHDVSTLISLKDAGPIGPFGLVARARADAALFAEVLGSFGYYKARIGLTIAGRPLDAPGLADFLDGLPPEPPAAIEVTVQRGPLFHLRHVTLEGYVPPGSDLRLGLAPGAPATAGPVLAERERLLNALRQDGYALAKVEPPVAILREQEDALDVAFPFTAGPRVDLGPIRINGLQRMNESFVRGRLQIAQGQRFDPAAIEAARQDLASLGVFASVRMQLGMNPNAPALDREGQLPVLIDVTERQRHSVRVSAGYSTDLGAEVATSWEDRNLFGNAENLLLSASANDGGSAARAPGYVLRSVLTLPDTGARDQSLIVALGALDQSLQAYDIRAVTADLRLERRLSTRWKVAVGLGFAQQNVTQQGVSRDYTLLGLPLSATYDSTDSLLNPTQGIRVAATVTPMRSVAPPSANFTLLQVAGSGYLDLGAIWREPGRSVLAMRGLIGEAVGATQFQLPPDRRFYAGGSTTVRGYKYQSVGPQFPNHDPEGGTTVAAGSLEFRQRILEDYGAVAFIDAGQVDVGSAPLAGAWHFGAGVGARYYTSIGPIRLDVAVPLQRLPGGDSFELYLGIGQAF